MLRPFIPARDHDVSRRFYEALGFRVDYADDSVAVMSFGTDSFILQNVYVPELAANFMVQLSVGDGRAWWDDHDPERLAEQFGTKPPTAPVLQPWGLVVGFIHDPSGVLWHVTGGAG